MLRGRRRRGINILDASKMGNRFLGKWTIHSHFLVLPKKAPTQYLEFERIIFKKL
jgi:hypothetical protein